MNAGEVTLIGLTGKLGAGKDTVADYLVKKKNFKKYGCSDILKEKLKEEGKEASIDNLIELGNGLREKIGPGVLAEMLLEKISQNEDMAAVIVGLRHPAEVKTLKESGAKILSIESPQELRFERIQKRGEERDKISLEEFKKQEEIQLQGRGNSANIIQCIELADQEIDNGNGWEHLYEQVERAC